ncbi:MAG: substrate-binding domain-containing protein [Bacteroidetes bacterium]|nr:substrate-binding domain-containing protein [Bacteroidota bacterium]
MMKIKLAFLLLFFIHLFSAQSDTVYVYGPGGPKQPMIECAQFFEIKTKIPVKIISGPMLHWKKLAQQNADILYSGSEYMMNDYFRVFSNEFLDQNSVLPLYYRNLGLVVRKGNPKKIKRISDLSKDQIKIMVVDGAGLIGTWEDAFSVMTNIHDYRKIRKNIVFFAENSGIAEKKWRQDSSIDVWVTWNTWQLMNKDTSDFVYLPNKNKIRRNCAVVLTSSKKKASFQFYQFLQSNEAYKIFKKWGWN